MRVRPLVWPASVTVALAIVTACATSAEPDLEGDTSGNDGGAVLPDEPTKDAGSTSTPPKKTDAGSPGPTDAAPPQEAGPVDPAACDLSGLNGFIYAIEASDQAQPVPCPCDADAAVELCCYMGQTCLER